MSIPRRVRSFKVRFGVGLKVLVNSRHHNKPKKARAQAAFMRWLVKGFMKCCACVRARAHVKKNRELFVLVVS